MKLILNEGSSASNLNDNDNVDETANKLTTMEIDDGQQQDGTSQGDSNIDGGDLAAFVHGFLTGHCPQAAKIFKTSVEKNPQLIQDPVSANDIYQALQKAQPGGKGKGQQQKGKVPWNKQQQNGQPNRQQQNKQQFKKNQQFNRPNQKNQQQQQQNQTGQDNTELNPYVYQYQPKNQSLGQNPNSSGKKQPFRRVDPDKIQITRPELADNSFRAKQGFDRWGARAAQTLGAVRGKDFRKEKTKKKRGGYGGGPINTGVNSIKFTD